MNDGSTVRLVQPVIQGTIIDTRYRKDARAIEHLVDYVGADGGRHQRWFLESELEVVEQ